LRGKARTEASAVNARTIHAVHCVPCVTTAVSPYLRSVLFSADPPPRAHKWRTPPAASCRAARPDVCGGAGLQPTAASTVVPKKELLAGAHCRVAPPKADVACRDTAEAVSGLPHESGL
jgi:hypothetical protein